MLDQLFNLKWSKKDDVEIIEIDSEESNYTECLASEMPHSSAQSDGHKSTGIAIYVTCMV